MYPDRKSSSALQQLQPSQHYRTYLSGQELEHIKTALLIRYLPLVTSNVKGALNLKKPLYRLLDNLQSGMYNAASVGALKTAVDHGIVDDLCTWFPHGETLANCQKYVMEFRKILHTV